MSSAPSFKSFHIKTMDDSLKRMGLDIHHTRVTWFSKWHLYLLRNVYKAEKPNRMLVHLAIVCDKISAEEYREAQSRLHATEILLNKSAASECCFSKFDTSTIFNHVGIDGRQPFLMRRPRDDDFKLADEREIKNPLGIVQRPHGQRVLSVDKMGS